MCVCLRFEIHKKQGILVYCCIDLNFDGYTPLLNKKYEESCRLPGRCFTDITAFYLRNSATLEKT